MCCTAAHSFNLLLVGGYSCMQFLFAVHIWLVVARVTLELNCRNLAFLIALKENKQTEQNKNWGASICFGSEWQIAGWIVMSKCIYIWFYMCTGDENFIKIAADGLVCCDRSFIIIRGITRIMMLLHFQVAQTGISSEHVIMFTSYVNDKLSYLELQGKSRRQFENQHLAVWMLFKETKPGVFPKTEWFLCPNLTRP